MQDQRPIRKPISQMKKHSVSQKTRSNNPSSLSSKQAREDQVLAFSNRHIKSLGKKYLQDNCFKSKPKEHHQIVISDEVVKNSKLYQLLRCKIQNDQFLFGKESKQIKQVGQKVSGQVANIKNNNQQSKLALWQLKNQILQLKGILNDEEEEGKKLQQELQKVEIEQQQQAQNQMPQGQIQQEGLLDEPPLSIEQQLQQSQQNQEQNNEVLRQQEVDIRLMMAQLHKKMKINSQQKNENSQKKESNFRKEEEDEF